MPKKKDRVYETKLKNKKISLRQTGHNTRSENSLFKQNNDRSN